MAELDTAEGAASAFCVTLGLQSPRRSEPDQKSTPKNFDHLINSSQQLFRGPVNFKSPRLLYAINPASAKSKYRRVIRRIDEKGEIEYRYLADAEGVFSANGHFARSTVTYTFQARKPKGSPSQAEYGKRISRSSIEQDAPEVEVHDPRASQLSAYGGRQEVPPLDFEREGLPSDASQSARSTEKIRSLREQLGGEQLTERHGKPPPMSAPYYLGGTTKEGDLDSARIR